MSQAFVRFEIFCSRHGEINALISGVVHTAGLFVPLWHTWNTVSNQIPGPGRIVCNLTVLLGYTIGLFELHCTCINLCFVKAHFSFNDVHSFFIPFFVTLTWSFCSTLPGKKNLQVKCSYFFKAILLCTVDLCFGSRLSAIH